MVPEAVRKQAEEADKALEAMASANAEQSTAEAAAEDAEASMELSGQPAGEDQATQTIAEDNDVMALKSELELERQRNRSLQGRIDSQLAKANSENKELKGQLNDLSAKVQELRRESAAPGSHRHLSEDEVKDMGEEVLGMQERIIKGTLEEELEGGTIKEFVENLVAKSMKAKADSSDEPTDAPVVDTDLYWDTVERYYPDARTLNSSDAEWFKFLDEYDSKSGLKNREVGAEAINSGDVRMLVNLLNAFRPVGHVEGQRKPSIKPEKTGAAPIVQSAAKPSFTKAEVEQFYDDVARRRFKGTKEEALAIENQIMEAAQEGRLG